MRFLGLALNRGKMDSNRPHPPFRIAISLCRGLSSLGVVVFFYALSACTLLPNQDVLIAIRQDDVPMLRDPRDPDPLDTGIPTLDELNRQWDVSAMTPVYPDIDPNDIAALDHGLAGVFKLAVPPLTDIDELLAAYEADTHIEYAEYNEPASILDP